MYGNIKNNYAGSRMGEGASGGGTDGDGHGEAEQRGQPQRGHHGGGGGGGGAGHAQHSPANTTLSQPVHCRSGQQPIQIDIRSVENLDFDTVTSME
jgi:hypothetical protein